jgi:hypothetical protein
MSIHRFIVSAMTNAGDWTCASARAWISGAAFARNTKREDRCAAGTFGSKRSNTFRCVASVCRVFQSAS